MQLIKTYFKLRLGKKQLLKYNYTNINVIFQSSFVVRYIFEKNMFRSLIYTYKIAKINVVLCVTWMFEIIKTKKLFYQTVLFIKKHIISTSSQFVLKWLSAHNKINTAHNIDKAFQKCIQPCFIYPSFPVHCWL